MSDQREKTDNDSNSSPALKKEFIWPRMKGEEDFICVDEGGFKGWKKKIKIEGQTYMDVRGVSQFLQVMWKKKGPKLRHSQIIVSSGWSTPKKLAQLPWTPWPADC